MRVGAFIRSELEARGNVVDVVDPLTVDLELLRRPHFAYPPAEVPPVLADLADRLQLADGFAMVTPEYNHAPGPALLNLLNHFGGSLFAFKPSAIVSYSAGQWGGCRAAHALRPFLSELGCLPVSAMVHVPSAQSAFDKDGVPRAGKGKEGEDEGTEALRWQAYAGRTLSQLEWWSDACSRQRAEVDPTVASPALRRSPVQRNAP